MSTRNRDNSAERRPVQMLLIVTLIAYPLLQGLTSFAAFDARTTHTMNKAEYAMADTSGAGQDYQAGDIKVLAEGFHSKITKPFVAVVRDAETYAALIKLDENLPKLDAEFFKENVAVAAFLGERNTGGYRVEILANGIEISVLEKKPGKGVMVPQMITSPFRIVSVPVAGERLLLSLDNAWHQHFHTYRVIRGTFTMSGGFAGKREQFEFSGEVQVWRERGLATFGFDLLSSDPARQRLLKGVATGLVQDDGAVRINRMAADGFVNTPNGGLKAAGQFMSNQGLLSLIFSPGPSMIADGYEGQGSLEAAMRVAID